MKQKEYPIFNGIDTNKLIGQLYIDEFYIETLHNYHFAPSFIAKEIDGDTITKAEIVAITLVSDNNFTNSKGEKFYSETEYRKAVNESEQNGKLKMLFAIIDGMYKSGRVIKKKDKVVGKIEMSREFLKSFGISLSKLNKK